MDPDQARSKMIESANLLKALLDRPTQVLPPDDVQAAADALVEAVHDLDEWLRKGGFLPDVWDRGGDANQSRLRMIPVGIGKEQDDERPRVDGGVCGHVIEVAPYDSQPDRICVLDRGHEGGHS